MKVKRIIKSFIYLLPVLVVCVTALANTLFRLNKNFSGVIRESTGNTATTYQYGSTVNDIANPIFNGLEQFNNIMVDIDPDLYNSVFPVVVLFGLGEDNDGTLTYFVSNVICYEMIAIMICAVLDVIFLIPEFYNKIEDKYIRGGKKRE